jgi:hypothetical protein
MVLDSYKAYPEVQKLSDSKGKEQYLELEIE